MWLALAQCFVIRAHEPVSFPATAILGLCNWNALKCLDKLAAEWTDLPPFGQVLVVLRRSCEAQFDELECRDLLDEGDAEYYLCAAAFNFGVPDVTKEAPPRARSEKRMSFVRSCYRHPRRVSCLGPCT